jgi:3-phenylpropionate/trans-cinnamate dioxygenase ferredoxin reductase subunit
MRMIPPPVSPKRRSRRRAQRETFVIIGAGQAGSQAAHTLRERGFTGRIRLLGDEAQAPYQRPPLSKAFLGNALSVDRLYLRPQSSYDINDIELQLHSPVERIERNAMRIVLRNGKRIGYDRLLIATGSRPRTLRVAGGTGTGVHYLCTLADSLSLRSKIGPGRRVVIVGGGYIGLEVAATAATAGAIVTVLETEERVLSRVTSVAVSDFFAAAHRRHCVEIECNAHVMAFEAGERLEAIVCAHRSLKADVAVVGIGAEPNVELASGAGLPCDNGIVVDEYCRTVDPNIFAAGDCSNHFNAFAKRRIRLESVQNAVDQATVAALNMLGEECRYAEVPWFWSNQYAYKIQTAGSFAGFDEIEERGNREEGRFAVVYRAHGALLAIDAINMPREYMSVRKELSDSRLIEVSASETRAKEPGVAKEAETRAREPRVAKEASIPGPHAGVVQEQAA